MAGRLLLRVAAYGGFLLVTAGGVVFAHRLVPRAYPRERTLLDERTYRVVRTAVAVGAVMGLLGASLSVVDAVGTVLMLGQREKNLLAALAILIPLGVARGMLYAGVALLVGGSLLAGAVELRNARA